MRPTIQAVALSVLLAVPLGAAQRTFVSAETGSDANPFSASAASGNLNAGIFASTDAFVAVPDCAASRNGSIGVVASQSGRITARGTTAPRIPLRASWPVPSRS